MRCFALGPRLPSGGRVKRWLDTLDDYESSFCHVVGPPESMAKVAERMESSCLKGATASRRIFK